MLRCLLFKNLKKTYHEIYYRDFAFFLNSEFDRDLTEEFSHQCLDFSNKFDEIFLKVFLRH